MNEMQLERMLAWGGLQLRLNAALRWSCGAVLAGSVAAALMIVVARLRPALAFELLAASWFLGLLVLILGIVGFLRCRPTMSEVALRLDRVAALQEHLTTWEEFHRRGLPQDAVARSFALLQRAATLRSAVGLRPGRLMPLRLPVWSRGLWLAILLLGCAVLMPEQRVMPGRMSSSGEGQEDSLAAQGTLGQKPAAGKLSEAFSRIEILSPGEIAKYKLAAFGDAIPEVFKAEALKEFEAKVGSLSEAELSAEVRELLAALRRQVQGAETTQPKAASVTVDGSAKTRPGSASGPDLQANAPAPQELVAVVQASFPDVAEALHRYYLGDSRSRERR